MGFTAFRKLLLGPEYGADHEKINPEIQTANDRLQRVVDVHDGTLLDDANATLLRYLIDNVL